MPLQNPLTFTSSSVFADFGLKKFLKGYRIKVCIGLALNFLNFKLLYLVTLNVSDWYQKLFLLYSSRRIKKFLTSWSETLRVTRCSSPKFGKFKAKPYFYSLAFEEFLRPKSAKTDEVEKS